MSAKTESDRLRRLISHGYFAPELPPCFVSEDLAKHRASVLTTIDALPTIRGQAAVHNLVTEPAWFYFPRFGKDQRRFGVPNPFAHLALSRVLAKHYVTLRKTARTSNLSLSPPIFDWNGPRALTRPNVLLRDEHRVDLSSRHDFYVAADIRAFFHSIYTHSIPWAIHSKATAKANKNDHALFGNVIDKLCRNAQNSQSIGLPVGPDTSRLIAEVVASAIDAELQKRLKIGRHDASRYIDDYTLSSPHGASGEELLATLRQVAADFELTLNNEKSEILLTSRRQSTGWQHSVRKLVPHPVSARAPIEAAELQGYFYELGRICQNHPNINIEKFGLQNARSALVAADNWKPVQSSLISAYRRNSSLVSFLVEACLLRQAEHKDVFLDQLRHFIENRMAVLARENRTGEAIWLLFLALRLDIILSSKCLTSFFSIDNALVALLIVCLNHRGKIDGKIDRSGWDTALTADGLCGPMWLYAYEGVAQGFLPGVNDGFITKHAYFSALHAKKIRFLEVERGFTSIIATMKSLRSTNVRMERLRAAISNNAQQTLDEFEERNEVGEEEKDDDVVGDY